MLKYSILIIMVFGIMIPNIAFSQYWFQTGAVGVHNTSFNNGAGISIKTNYNQSIDYGSYGFWVGETLNNNAFIQIGYLVENQTGYYPTNCNLVKCSDKIFINKGQPAWFWEYFLQNSSIGSFYGSVGTDGMGNSGGFNNYSFKSLGDIWIVYMNGRSIGSINLGVNNSGLNAPMVTAEDAGTDTNTTFMSPVEFKNFRIYKNGRWLNVPSAFSSIGYGRSSRTLLKNNYGIKEKENRINYFEIGSGLPLLKNGSVLWSLGYTLKIRSRYGNNETAKYASLSTITISEPAIVKFSDSERAVFRGWIGTGPGSYTGNSTNTLIHMYGNIEERAVWTLQDRITVHSNRSVVTGGGWYDYGSTARISVKEDVLYVNSNERYKFKEWSNNFSEPDTTFIVTGPENITAKWKIEYLVNASSRYGNVTGGGWYDYGSTATIALHLISKNSNQYDNRIAFFSWNNGIHNTSYKFKITRPVDIVARFGHEYLQHIEIRNMGGKAINFSYILINNKKYYKNNIYLFVGKNSFKYVNVYGYNLSINKTVDVPSSKDLSFSVQLYDVNIKTTNLFEIPINVSLDVNFINGTSKQLVSGSNGLVSLHNVIEGYVRGMAVFDNKTKYFNSESSKDITIKFVSSNVMMYAFVFALIISIMGFLIARKHHRKYM